MKIQALDAAVAPRLIRRSGNGLQLVAIGQLDQSVIAMHGTSAELVAWAQQIIALASEAASEPAA